jgi:hypothetical protein
LLEVAADASEAGAKLAGKRVFEFLQGPGSRGPNLSHQFVARPPRPATARGDGLVSLYGEIVAKALGTISKGA